MWPLSDPYSGPCPGPTPRRRSHIARGWDGRQHSLSDTAIREAQMLALFASICPKWRSGAVAEGEAVGEGSVATRT